MEESPRWCLERDTHDLGNGYLLSEWKTKAEWCGRDTRTSEGNTPAPAVGHALFTDDYLLMREGHARPQLGSTLRPAPLIPAATPTVTAPPSHLRGITTPCFPYLSVHRPLATVTNPLLSHRLGWAFPVTRGICARPELSFWGPFLLS